MQQVVESGVARLHQQIVRTAGVAGAAQSELARRIARQEIALLHASVHQPAALRPHTFVVERRAAQTARQIGHLVDADAGREHGLTDAVQQETRPPIQATAAHRAHPMSDQTRGDARLEQHRHLTGGNLARTQPRDGALASAPAQRLGGLQGVGRAGDAVPVVALHRLVLASNNRAIERVPAAVVAVAKTQRIGVDKAVDVARHRGAVAVVDARIDRHRRRLHAASQCDRLLAVQRPRVTQVEVGCAPGQQIGLRQAGERVLAGVAGDRQRRRHRLGDCRRRDVRGAGVAAPLADPSGHRQTAIARVFERLDLAQAHRHIQAVAQSDVDLGGAGP